MNEDERSFVLVETERFTAEIGTTLGRERWADLKPPLEAQLARQPHRFQQIANSNSYAIGLITGHVIYFSIDFEHGRVTLWGII